MSARSILGLCGLPLLGLTGPVVAQAPPPPGADLKATIALNGFPCDQVVQAVRNADSDYTAVCRDGNRYHIYVDRTGRVVVKKL